MSIHEFIHPALNITIVKQVYDGIEETIRYTIPRAFIEGTFDALQRGADFSIKEEYRTAYPVEGILALFCTRVFSTNAENPTTLWKDNETGAFYLVAYDYSEQDYYSTAFSYLTVFNYLTHVTV